MWLLTQWVLTLSLKAVINPYPIWANAHQNSIHRHSYEQYCLIHVKTEVQKSVMYLKLLTKLKIGPLFWNVILSQGILNRPFLLGPEIMPRILQTSNTKFLPTKHRKELIQILRHTTVYVFNYTQCLDSKWKFWCLCNGSVWIHNPYLK